MNNKNNKLAKKNHMTCDHNKASFKTKMRKMRHIKINLAECKYTQCGGTNMTFLYERQLKSLKRFVAAKPKTFKDQYMLS